jgi:hypothetical protein
MGVTVGMGAVMDAGAGAGIDVGIDAAERLSESDAVVMGARRE